MGKGEFQIFRFTEMTNIIIGGGKWYFFFFQKNLCCKEYWDYDGN